MDFDAKKENAKVINYENETKQIFVRNKTGMGGLYFVYRTGSVFEPKGFRGTRHLMEHLIAKNLPDAFMNTLDKEGLSWNMATSPEIVFVECTGLDRCIRKIELEFSKILSNLHVPDCFDSEKKVVLEEIADCMINFEECSYKESMEMCFDGYRDAVGLEKDVTSFSKEDAESGIRNLFSSPSLIIRVGEAPMENIFIRQPSFERTPKMKFKNDVPAIHAFSDKILFNCVCNKIISKEDFIAVDFLCDILNDGLQSPLCSLIRNNGLSYYSASILRSYVDYGVLSFMSCTRYENYDALENVYNTFFSDVDRYITEERFLLVKNKWIISEEKRKIESYKSYRYLYYGLVNRFEGYEKFTLEDMRRVAKKYLSPSRIRIVAR